MKNLFKRYGIIIAAFAFVFSVAISSAQIGGNAQMCLIWNEDAQGNRTTCRQWATIGTQPGQPAPTSGGVPTGGTPTCPPGSVLVNVQGRPMCQSQQGGMSQPGGMGGVYQNQNLTRQSNVADLSFFSNLLGSFGNIIRMLPPILIGVAVVAFFAFLIKYFMAPSAEAKKENLHRMGYSLAALFVMVALWGIIAFFGDAIGINPNVQVTAPRLPQ